MSSLVHIRTGMCQCCWWLRDLKDMWLHEWGIMRRRWMSRRIWLLRRGHERMRNDEEPIHVVGRTLTWHKTYLTCWCKMVWVVHPAIVYFFKWHPWNNSLYRNTLDVSKLAHDPLWSVSDGNGLPSELTGKAWNQIKLPKGSVLPIRHPANMGILSWSRHCLYIAVDMDFTIAFVAIHRYACGDTSS